MDLRPLPPERYANDSTLERVRRCAKCGGEMRCKGLIEYRVNGGYSGRDYTFACAGCGKRVTELSSMRVMYLGGVILGGGGLGGMLVFYGLKILIQTVQHGPGGNDLSAVIMVLVVFLGIGAPFLLLMLWGAKTLIADWLELMRNPVMR